MANNRGGYRPGAGRPKGSKSRATLEREALAQQRADLIEQQRKASGRKLSVEHMDDNLQFSAKMAAWYLPVDGNPHANKREYMEWSKMVMAWAQALAPYQSPTFRAVTVAPAPVPTEDERERVFTLNIFEGGRVINAKAVGPPKLQKDREAEVLEALAIQDSSE